MLMCRAAVHTFAFNRFNLICQTSVYVYVFVCVCDFSLK
jgi:hypothetical protein